MSCCRESPINEIHCSGLILLIGQLNAYVSTVNRWISVTVHRTIVDGDLQAVVIPLMLAD